MKIADINYPVDKNILRILSKKRIKQQEVAEQAGYTLTQFNDMLNGRKIIKVCDVQKIVSILNVDANTLFKG